MEAVAAAAARLETLQFGGAGAGAGAGAGPGTPEAPAPLIPGSPEPPSPEPPARPDPLFPAPAEPPFPAPAPVPPPEPLLPAPVPPAPQPPTPGSRGPLGAAPAPPEPLFPASAPGPARPEPVFPASAAVPARPDPPEPLLFPGPAAPPAPAPPEPPFPAPEPPFPAPAPQPLSPGSPGPPCSAPAPAPARPDPPVPGSARAPGPPEPPLLPTAVPPLGQPPPPGPFGPPFAAPARPDALFPEPPVPGSADPRPPTPGSFGDQNNIPGMPEKSLLPLPRGPEKRKMCAQFLSVHGSDIDDYPQCTNKRYVVMMEMESFAGNNGISPQERTFKKELIIAISLCSADHTLSSLLVRENLYSRTCALIDARAHNRFVQDRGVFRPDTDTDSDSSSSSSSSSSTSSSSLSLPPVVSDGEDDLQAEKDNKACPLKTKDELLLEELPSVEELTIILPEEVELKPFGVVSSIIEQLVIIESLTDLPPINEESIIFKGDRHAAGKIFEIFGPVSHPFYVLRFNSSEHIEKKSIKLKDTMYFAPSMEDFTQYIFTEKLKQDRGSDASWKNDQEPPPEALDFSDDEKEKEAKQKKKSQSQGRKKLKPESNDPGGNYGDVRQHWSAQRLFSEHPRGYQNREFTRGFPRARYPQACYPRPAPQQYFSSQHIVSHESSLAFLPPPPPPPPPPDSPIMPPYPFPPPVFDLHHFPPPPPPPPPHLNMSWPVPDMTAPHSNSSAYSQFPPPPPPPPPPPSQGGHSSQFTPYY
ncbi:H/ACA ribonucleoprotein complex non-core subunit NAF1 [Tachyglossus aculeatus]|nr:H/ACA ribonucleoprotein complex non-core subunit NAF1 [Tachyglossus aculeatus]